MRMRAKDAIRERVAAEANRGKPSPEMFLLTNLQIAECAFGARRLTA